MVLYSARAAQSGVSCRLYAGEETFFTYGGMRERVLAENQSINGQMHAEQISLIKIKSQHDRVYENCLCVLRMVVNAFSKVRLSAISVYIIAVRRVVRLFTAYTDAAAWGKTVYY